MTEWPLRGSCHYPTLSTIPSPHDLSLIWGSTRENIEIDKFLALMGFHKDEGSLNKLYQKIKCIFCAKNFGYSDR